MSTMPRTQPQIAHTLNLTSPVAQISGIGPKRAQALAERGLVTLEDVLFHLPSRYQDWRERRTIAQLTAGTSAVVEGVLSGVRERPMRGSRWRRLVTATLTDAAGARLRLVWFNLPSYMRGRMPEGQAVAVFGRVTMADDHELEMMHPELRAQSDGSEEPIRPVYRVPDAMPQRLYGTVVARALNEAAHEVADAIPQPVRAASGLTPICDALRYLHHPPVDADIRRLQNGASPGHSALALDELFTFELAMCVERERSARRRGMQLRGDENGLAGRFVATLPFQLTGAQNHAIEEIARDLAAPRQMNRILIGDVGSGKTAVAFWAILRAVEAGAQAAM